MHPRTLQLIEQTLGEPCVKTRYGMTDIWYERVGEHYTLYYEDNYRHRNKGYVALTSYKTIRSLFAILGIKLSNIRHG